MKVTNKYFNFYMEQFALYNTIHGKCYYEIQNCIPKCHIGCHNKQNTMASKIIQSIGMELSAIALWISAGLILCQNIQHFSEISRFVEMPPKMSY